MENTNKHNQSITNEIAEEIKFRQGVILKLIQNNHKITMRKLEKLQEYNEIDDMVNQVIEKRLNKIENMLKEINSKIA